MGQAPANGNGQSVCSGAESRSPGVLWMGTVPGESLGQQSWSGGFGLSEQLGGKQTIFRWEKANGLNAVLQLLVSDGWPGPEEPSWTSIRMKRFLCTRIRAIMKKIPASLNTIILWQGMWGEKN